MYSNKQFKQNWTCLHLQRNIVYYTIKIFMHTYKPVEQHKTNTKRVNIYKGNISDITLGMYIFKSKISKSKHWTY